MRVGAGALQRQQHIAHEVGLGKLQGADIDRNRPRGGLRRLRPGHQLGTGRFQHPLAQRQDQPGLFGQGNELCGRHHAAGRVAPAHQRLHALDGAVFLHLNLVKKLKFLAHQRLANGVGQGLPRLRSGLQGKVKKAHPVAPGRLGLVHGGVGLLQQLVHGFVALRKNRQANARGAGVGLGVQGVGFPQHRQDLAGDALGARRGVLVGAGQGFQHQHKLIAPQARQDIALAHTRLQPLGHLHQQRIAHGVTQAVVDLLEVVQVQQQHGPTLSAAGGRQHGVAQLVQQQAPVGQVG